MWKAGLWRSGACSCGARQNGSAPRHENLQIIIKKDMKASSCLLVPPSAPASTEELKALSAPTARWRPKPRGRRGKTVQKQGGTAAAEPANTPKQPD